MVYSLRLNQNPNLTYCHCPCQDWIIHMFIANREKLKTLSNIHITIWTKKASDHHNYFPDDVSWHPSAAQDATAEGAEDKEETECQSHREPPSGLTHLC